MTNDLESKSVAAVLERAIFDVAVVQALKPLRPFERDLVLQQRILPDQLNDPRVLAAIARAPAALVPLRPDEREAVAEIVAGTGTAQLAAVRLSSANAEKKASA